MGTHGDVLLQCYSVPLKEGDIIVAGTDGVWDNLFDQECAALVSQTKSKGQNPGDTAEALARFAHIRYAPSRKLHTLASSQPSSSMCKAADARAEWSCKAGEFLYTGMQHKAQVGRPGSGCT